MSEPKESSEKLQFVPLVGDEYDLFNRCFIHEYRKGFVKCENTILPDSFRSYLDRIRQMHVRDDDIWVITFPKSGTTWVQEMVWCIANDLNFEAARINLVRRFPFLEWSAIYNEAFASKKMDLIDMVSYSTEMPSPRFIKTHLPFELLPQKLQNSDTTAKIIYIMRNPADVCISYYHHMKSSQGFNSGLEDFCKLFLRDHVPYGPYWNHILGFWKRRQNLNMLILKYEDMMKDLPSTIKKIANFIGKPLLADDHVKKLTKHLSFENMKVNSAVNFVEERGKLRDVIGSVLDPRTDHFRCGKVGESMTLFTPELRECFQKWIQNNTIDLNINLKYE